MTLLQRRLTPDALAELIASAPREVARVGDEQYAGLAARLRAVPALEHRRLDAWMIEQAGRESSAFHWTPATARRILGSSALRRTTEPRELLSAVRDEVADQLLRSVRGYARAGSLAHWLSGVSHPVLGVITVEALDWATQALDCASDLGHPWRVATSDVYFDVAGARTTLRGRRDFIIDDDDGRVIVRLRSGRPGKSAGPGLRGDLVVDTFAHPRGEAPRRYLGLWPEAGVVLGVDGTMENVRSGARDFVRAAVVQRRHALARAA